MGRQPNDLVPQSTRALFRRPRSLLERTHSSFWVTSGGTAVSQSQVGLEMAVRYTYLMFGAGLVAGIGVLAGGVVGGLVGAGVGVALLVGVVRAQRFQIRFAALMRRGRHREAEALCRRVAQDGRASPMRRFRAHHGIAQVRLFEGAFAQAHEELRQAAALRDLCACELSHYEQADAAYAEVFTLVNLGRLAEARACLVRLSTPKGDFLRIRHWIAELAVQFGEGALTIAEDDLWERTRVGLAVLSSRSLVPLCAWAFADLGNHDMADHLREVALDRGIDGLERMFPSLHRWLQSYRAA